MSSDRDYPIDSMNSGADAARRQLGRRELIRDTTRATAVGTLSMLLLGSDSSAAIASAPTRAAVQRDAKGPFEPAVATLLANVRHGDSAVRQAAALQASLVGTAAIAPLAVVLGADDAGASKTAQAALQRIVHNAARPDAAPERRSAAEALVSIASSGQPHPLAVRAESVRLLGYVGGPSEVAALSDLLHVPDLREDARFALESIPDPAAGAALKKAARTVPADYRAAIDQSLRRRRLRPQEIGLRR